MRRPVLVAMLLLAVSAWPASAQLFPAGSQEPKPAERVILDTTLELQSPDDQHGLCTLIEAGTLTVRARLLVSDPPTPTIFALGDRDGPDGLLPILINLDPQEQTATTVLTNPVAVYCWGVNVQMAGQVGQLSRQVTRAAIRMTLSTP